MIVAIARWDSTVIIDTHHCVDDWRRVMRDVLNAIRSNGPIPNGLTVKVIKRKK